MCGIVGYIGPKSASSVLLEGLEKLEYRGYDSAGMAVRSGEMPVQIAKARGRLSALAKMTDGGRLVPGNCGIGHTRWSTHGAASVENAHPHCSDDRNVVAVHNGIIENYLELKQKLRRKGYVFYSDTDTEVAVKLIDYYHKKYGGTPMEAMARSMMRMRGSYALAVMFASCPDEIFAARKDSPLVIGMAEGETHLASDARAILKYTRSIYHMEDMEIARLGRGDIQFFNVDEERVDKQPVEIGWEIQESGKDGFEHYMLKEIYQQPVVVGNTIASMLCKGEVDIEKTGLSDADIRSLNDIYIVGCGSAYHAGLIMRRVMEELVHMPVHAELASEFRYRKMLIGQGTLLVVISQSGETADSLAALRLARREGAKILALVNVAGSAIAREADYVVHTLAGPEIAVATTKAYSAQLAASYLLALKFARVRGSIEAERYAQLVSELNLLPQKIADTLACRESMQLLAAKICNVQNAFFIGRGMDHAACMEGSLKLKEVSYIHSEAFAAGELKHGAISLIEEGTLVVGVSTDKALREKMQSNMAECKCRGAWLVGIESEQEAGLESFGDCCVPIPGIDPLFAASLSVLPMQLLAYYVSIARGLDVDKPRNLAKSVTVE